MEIRKQPRRSGKTTDLILEMIRDKNTILLVHCINLAIDLREEYPLIAMRIHTFNEVARNRQRINIKTEKILIDEIGICLDGFFQRETVSTC